MIKGMAARESTLHAINTQVYLKKSYAQSVEAVAKQWENLLELLGQPVIPAVTRWLRLLAKPLNEVGAFFKEH